MRYHVSGPKLIPFVVILRRGVGTCDCWFISVGKAVIDRCAGSGKGIKGEQIS